MAAKKAKDIEKALNKKGFVPRPEKGDHHKHFYFRDENGGVTAIYTYLSHGTKEYGDHLLQQMAKQLQVNKKQLLDIINCPLNEKDLRKHYTDAGVL